LCRTAIRVYSRRGFSEQSRSLDCVC
jgi:hypothetical protein